MANLFQTLGSGIQRVLQLRFAGLVILVAVIGLGVVTSARAAPVTLALALTDNSGGDAGSIVFTYDEADPLIAQSPPNGSLPLGTVFFLITDLSIQVSLDDDDLGITPNNSANAEFGDLYPTLLGGFTLDLSDIVEDGIAFIPASGSLIEASPATATGFTDIALFTWTLQALPDVRFFANSTDFGLTLPSGIQLPADPNARSLLFGSVGEAVPVSEPAGSAALVLVGLVLLALGVRLQGRRSC